MKLNPIAWANEGPVKTHLPPQKSQSKQNVVEMPQKLLFLYNLLKNAEAIPLEWVILKFTSQAYYLFKAGLGEIKPIPPPLLFKDKQKHIQEFSIKQVLTALILWS